MYVYVEANVRTISVEPKAILCAIVIDRERERESVCVCVCERERERERRGEQNYA